jgi:2-isopropylmalate synthase
MEGEGYQFEGADASLELMMRRADGSLKEYFELIGFSVTTRREKTGKITSEATMRLVVNGREEHTTASGDGPVNALDNALREALEKFYPELKEMTLSDFKVRVIDSGRGTASRVRVIIESSDKKKSWNTVGVSENIMEASWQALVDSVVYKLSTSNVSGHKKYSSCG